MSAYLSRPDDRNYLRNDDVSLSSARLGPAAIDDVALAEQLLGCFPSELSRTARSGLTRIVPAVGPLVPFDAARLTDDELASLLWERVREAVAASIVGARRIAVALGGLDSSALLAAVCELRPTADVVAYTYDYEEGADVPFARELCRAYGVELEVLRVDPDSDPTQGLVIDGLPYWAFSGGHELAFQRVLARAGRDLMLCGAYGDDVLGGELWMVARDLVRHPWRTVERLRRVRTPNGGTLARRFRSATLPWSQRLVPAEARLRRVMRGFRRRAPWLAERVFDLGARGVAATARGYVAAADAHGWHAELVRRVTRSWGPRAQTVVAGGVSRADPFVAPDFIAFAAAIPFERLWLGDEHRGLIRRALPERVPSTVRRRQSKANPTRDLQRLAQASVDPLRRYASVERLAAKGLVDPSRFASAFSSMGPSAPIVWSVLSAEAFVREVS